MAESDLTTIQVHKPTVERLSALKLPGLTYEDVINFALDKLPPQELEKLYADWQKEAIAKLSRSSRPLRRKT
ncbi:MAG: hypothetical protein ACYDDF_03130 [Thermoplasmatota archaeon]